MFRIAPIYANARFLLVSRSIPKLHIRPRKAVLQLPSTHNAYKHNQVLERDPCPPPPVPPPPPPKDDRLLWGAIAAALITGAFVVYAKQNPEIRDWLSLNAPWFDEFVAIVYQENMTYTEYLQNLSNYLKNCVNWFKKPCPDDKMIGVNVPNKPDDCEDSVVIPCEPVPSLVLEKNICEVERCLKELNENIYEKYSTARKACVDYNNLVERTMTDFTSENVEELRESMIARQELLKETQAVVEDNTKKIDDLSRFVECGSRGSQCEKDVIKTLVKDLACKNRQAQIELEWEKDKSLGLDQHWQKMEVSKAKFEDDMQTMFPGLDYKSEKPQLKGDLDLYLLHTSRTIKSLKKELAEAQKGMSERVDRSLASLPQDEKEKKERDAVLQKCYKTGKAELDKEYAKKCAEFAKAKDEEIKHIMRCEKLKSEELLKTRIKEREDKLMSTFCKKVDERVACEKRIFDIQLNEAKMMLKIVEDKLEAQLKAERESRRSQELWNAGSSLLRATKKGGQFVCVNKELKAIEKAAGGDDKLVTTVLKAIPSSVKEEGLVPESALRQTYHEMEKTALDVALVEGEGGPLPIYFLSWLQSKLLFMKFSDFADDPADRPPAPPPKELDTFDLLQRARYYIERGNIPAALRYVDSLQGASRLAADGWVTRARSHLETRQAAEAVQSHAAALALQYLN